MSNGVVIMIDYVASLENVSAEKLTGFFVGWPNPPTPETHLKILKAAHTFVLAVDSERQQVVGFINAISDGIQSAYIPLLEVLPEYKNRGIGKELVKRILSEFVDLYMVDLTCDKQLQPYYEKLGLVPMTGMMKRNFERQAAG